jgi:integrase
VKIDGFVLNHHTPDPAEVRKVIDVRARRGAARDRAAGDHGRAGVGDRNLRRCDIEVDGKRVHLRLSGKTGTRRFPLPEPIAETMRLRAGSEATSAFPSLRQPKDQALRSRLARACKRAGVKAFTPHGLRRMVVDRMLRAGVDPATAASLTGHSVVVMLRFYRQVTEADREAAVAKAALAAFPAALICRAR